MNAEEEFAAHDPDKCPSPFSPDCTCRCPSCVRYHRYDGYSEVRLVDILIAAVVGSGFLALALATIFSIIKLF